MLIINLNNEWINITQLKKLIGKNILIQNKTRGNIFIFPQDSNITPPTKQSGVFIKSLNDLTLTVYTENFFVIGLGQIIILPLGNDLLSNTIDVLDNKIDELIVLETNDEPKWSSNTW